MRLVDDVIDYIKNYSRFSGIEKQIMIARLDTKPTKEEIERAREIVYAKEANCGG